MGEPLDLIHALRLLRDRWLIMAAGLVAVRMVTICYRGEYMVRFANPRATYLWDVVSTWALAAAPAVAVVAALSIRERWAKLASTALLLPVALVSLCLAPLETSDAENRPGGPQYEQIAQLVSTSGVRVFAYWLKGGAIASNGIAVSREHPVISGRLWLAGREIIEPCADGIQLARIDETHALARIQGCHGVVERMIDLRLGRTRSIP